MGKTKPFNIALKIGIILAVIFAGLGVIMMILIPIAITKFIGYMLCRAGINVEELKAKILTMNATEALTILETIESSEDIHTAGDMFVLAIGMLGLKGVHITLVKREVDMRIPFGAAKKAVLKAIAEKEAFETNFPKMKKAIIKGLSFAKFDCNADTPFSKAFREIEENIPRGY